MERSSSAVCKKAFLLVKIEIRAANATGRMWKTHKSSAGWKIVKAVC